MKRLLFILCCMVVMTACQQQTDKSENSTPIESSENGNMPVILEFSATWCGPCQQLKPIFEALEEQYKGQVKMESIDVDENASLAKKYNIDAVPTIILFDTQGDEVERIVGYVPKEKLDNAIKSLLSK